MEAGWHGPVSQIPPTFEPVMTVPPVWLKGLCVGKSDTWLGGTLFWPWIGQMLVDCFPSGTVSMQQNVYWLFPRMFGQKSGGAASHLRWTWLKIMVFPDFPWTQCLGSHDFAVEHAWDLTICRFTGKIPVDASRFSLDSSLLSYYIVNWWILPWSTIIRQPSLPIIGETN